VYCWKTFCS